jgi:hypothetical protein
VRRRHDGARGGRVLAAAQARRAAIDAADRGDHDEAQRLLRTASARLGDFAAVSGRRTELSTQIDDLRGSAESIGQENWTAAARKNERFKEYRARHRRE